MRNRSPEAASWPRVELVARAKWTDELFIRAVGTGRPITVDLVVGNVGREHEGEALLKMGRAGQANWWRASWVRADSGKVVRVVI